jgi:hypothetical protein
VKKTRTAVKTFAGLKMAKYLFKNPVRGTKNVLALQGLRSLAMTKRAALITAAAVTTAVAVPLALRAARNSER